MVVKVRGFKDGKKRNTGYLFGRSSGYFNAGDAFHSPIWASAAILAGLSETAVAVHGVYGKDRNPLSSCRCSASTRVLCR